MSNAQITIISLLVLSVLFLAVPSLCCILRRTVLRASYHTRKRSGISRVLIFSLFLICSVWCLRYAVGYCSIISADDKNLSLTFAEEVFNSFLHTLQTFSMDEDYTEYILSGKQMIRELFPSEAWLGEVYGLYASALNFVAPIAGGAIIFEIIARIFPKLRLLVSGAAIWREKYYFSELNDASIALAQSIYSSKRSFFKRPIMIFTDSYVDDEKESDIERLAEAKSLGAICVRDDIAHVKKNRYGRKSFFLIDSSEANNLQAFVDISNAQNERFIRGSQIFLFVNSDAYVQVEKSIIAKLTASLGHDGLPTVVPIKSYMNMISNLLVDVPLYEPLIGKTKNEDGSVDLTVTILGGGSIGTEMFLSVYWIGQILNCNLTVNVMSCENEGDFWDKIDYLNPEIKHTMNVSYNDTEQQVTQDDILKINRHGDMADYYCRVNYYECDVKSSIFMDHLRCCEDSILDTDYYLVALGTDEENISVANTIKRYTAEHHIETASRLQSKEKADKKTVITYVVYDAELSDTLNSTQYFRYVNDNVDIYMRAVGNIRDVNSERIILMPEYEKVIEEAHETYLEMQQKPMDKDGYKNERQRMAAKHSKRMIDDYNYWSNLARRLHFKYKMFSASQIYDEIRMPSLFENYSADEYEYRKKQALEGYICLITMPAEDEKKEKQRIELLHMLAWLEHRRWNAFMRVMGYRHSSAYDIYASPDAPKSYKQMDIKLHPCLVECDKTGIKYDKEAGGFKAFSCKDRACFDLLDELSYDLHEKRLNSYDFKQYDYPISDINKHG